MSAEDVNFEEISTKVECVKIALTQDKNGFIFKMALNPADTPEEFLKDPVGQRYMAVFVRLDGTDQPVAAPSNEEGRRAVAMAGTLCADANFIGWLALNGDIDEATETAASVWLRKFLGVQSRKELMFNEKAREKLMGVRAEFINAIRQGRVT